MSNSQPPEDFTRLQQTGVLIFVIFCGLPAMELNGFGFSIPFTLGSAITCAAIGGVVGGALVCPRPLIAGVLGGLVAGPLGLVAVYYYTLSRESVWNLELVLIQGLGSLPGIGLGYSLKKILSPQRQSPRFDDTVDNDDYRY